MAIVVNGIPRKLNWRASPWHKRRMRLKAPAPVPVKTSVDPLDIPTEIPIWDQLQLGSCTMHGTGFIFSHRIKIETGTFFMPSRLFGYWNVRNFEGDTDDDTGAIIADVLTTISQFGLPPETMWPYDISKFTIKPPKAAYDAALSEIALSDSSIEISQDSIMQSLSAENPVTLGFPVYESFNDIGSDGIMPHNSGGIEGGHCVAAVGYQTEGYERENGIWFRNSWGTSWGKAGRFLMPWNLLGTCDDAWNILAVGAKSA